MGRPGVTLASIQRRPRCSSNVSSLIARVKTLSHLLQKCTRHTLTECFNVSVMSCFTRQNNSTLVHVVEEAIGHS